MPFKTALIRATTETKVLAGAHLSRPLVSSFCRHLFDALYEKWKPPETTTCKPGLTQAF